MNRKKMVIGYIPSISRQSTGFVTPVFRCGSSIFTEVEGEFPGDPPLALGVGSENVVALDPVYCEIAESDLNYGILFDAQSLAVGPKSVLNSVVRARGKHLFDDVAVYMQLAEIFGSSEEKRQASKAFSRALADVFSRDVSNRFCNDAVRRSVLWDHISKNIKIDGNREALSALRRVAIKDAEFETEYLFPEYIWEKLIPHLSVERTRFVTEFEKEVHSRTYLGDTEDAHEKAYRDHVLREVSRLGRQEQRVGRVLAAYIENPEFTREFLARYRDRSQFANEALSEFRKEIIRPHLLDESPEFIVAGFVDKLYTLCFPMQRGVLLYDLACTLRGCGAAADAVRSRADRSGSMYVIGAREMIHEVLDSPRTEGALDDLFAPRS